MSPLNVACVWPACTVCNGRLYVFGGSRSTVVEEYDFTMDKWKISSTLPNDFGRYKVFTIKNDLRICELAHKNNQEN